MPIVLAIDDVSEQTVSIVCPRKVAGDGGWAWDEVRVCQSSIAGYGLQPRDNSNVDWSAPKHPIALPLLGRETELNSQQEVDIFVRILKGAHPVFGTRANA